MIAPDSFELSDIDGTSSPVNEVVPADQEDAVARGRALLPGASHLIEESMSQNLREDENLERR